MMTKDYPKERYGAASVSVFLFVVAVPEEKDIKVWWLDLSP